jgi:hypothetical protein
MSTRAHEWLAGRTRWVQYPNLRATPRFWKHQMPLWKRLLLFSFGMFAIMFSAIMFFFLAMFFWALISSVI